jgi:imidazolonepropionase-like amidohydrolase
MRPLACLLVAIFLPLAQGAAQRTSAHTIELRGGRWLTGSAFEPRHLYVVDGRFADRRPAVVDSVVELGEQYVLPPFADAHTHLLTIPGTADAQIVALERAGIFYVLSLTGSARGRRAIASRVNRPGSVDVAYADAFTSTRGHPILSAEVTANGIPWDSLRQYWPRLLSSHRAEGDVYFTVDSLSDLERKWPRLRANAPDLVKIYLMDTERFAELSRDTTSLDENGLDPALVPAIVARAHRDGLRVAAHVETAADFRIAIRAGVDIIAHLPGLAPRATESARRYLVTDADAREARDRGAVVVPTAWLAERLAAPKPWLGDAVGDTAQLRRAQEIQRASLAALRRAGVTIAMGSDLFEDAVTETLYLHRIGALDAAAALNELTDITPRVAFPSRRIGRLAPGYEASLVTLDCDPLVRLECLREVRFRMKQGVAGEPSRH